MAAPFTIARGAVPDEEFHTLDGVARRLLELVDEADQAEATLLLRHAQVARGQLPNGACLALSTLDPEGGFARYHLAYVFLTPMSGDAHTRLEAAMRAARPDTFKPSRMIPWPKKERAA